MVYLVDCQPGLFKVGESGHPRHRVSCLSSGMPPGADHWTRRLIGVIDPNLECGEQYWHNRLSRFRIPGKLEEWYYDSVELRREFVGVKLIPGDAFAYDGLLETYRMVIVPRRPPVHPARTILRLHRAGYDVRAIAQKLRLKMIVVRAVLSQVDSLITHSGRRRDAFEEKTKHWK